MSPRRAARWVAGMVLVLSAAACGGEEPAAGPSPTTGAEESFVVGIAVPGAEAEPGTVDGEALEAALVGRGHEVELRSADGDADAQGEQVAELLEAGVDALVVTPVDPAGLTTALDSAGDALVVSYGRLVRGSPHVDFHVGFDRYQVGVQQVVTLLHGLGVTNLDGTPVENPPAGPFAVELFAGSPDDDGARAAFNGAMDTLRPYLDNGTLSVVSGEVVFEDVAVQDEDAEAARERMARLLEETYPEGTRLHGVLSPDDTISLAVLASLEEAGYGGEDRPWPVVTGAGAEPEAVGAILDGKQFATVFMDTGELATATSELVVSALRGEEPQVDDAQTYDNGAVVVPARLIGSRIVVRDNVREVLVDSGAYTAEELGLEEPAEPQG